LILSVRVAPGRESRGIFAHTPRSVGSVNLMNSRRPGRDQSVDLLVDSRVTAGPEFEKLQRDIFHGEVDTVVVWKLDRLSRSLRDGLNVLGDWCDRGLRIVSVTQQIDFNGTLGKLLAAVLLGVAEMEQETRRERQAAGIAAAKERGVYVGRRPGTTHAKPERALELRNKGLADREIAEALGVSRRTVQRYLRMADSKLS
jgi:DNA invertase Pin-like site-specific DNA recombinase